VKWANGLLLLFFQCAVSFLLVQVNDWLSLWALALFPFGLWPVLNGIFLREDRAVLISLATGLFLDSLTPFPLGFLGFSLAFSAFITREIAYRMKPMPSAMLLPLMLAFTFTIPLPGLLGEFLSGGFWFLFAGTLTSFLISGIFIFLTLGFFQTTFLAIVGQPEDNLLKIDEAH